MYQKSSTTTRKSGRFRAILAAGTILGLGAVVTLAAFTDQAKMTTDFTIGEVDIKLDGSQDGKPEPYKVGWNIGELSDLDEGSRTRYLPLTVNNQGSLPFNYQMSVEEITDEASKDAESFLKVGINKVEAESDCVAEKFGTTEVTGSTALQSLTIADRPIAKGGSEILCFKLELPTGADANKYMGAKLAPVFSFIAEQVAP